MHAGLAEGSLCIVTEYMQHLQMQGKQVFNLWWTLVIAQNNHLKHRDQVFIDTIFSI